MSASHAHVLGVDVGGTKLAVAAVEGTRCGEVLERPTELSHGEALLEQVVDCVRVVADRTGAPDAVGVGVPSQIDWATGRVVSSVNIPLEGIDLRTELERRLELPVYVDNDANCAALCEAQLVDGAPARHLVMLTLGTGVGGGVVIEGRIFRGASGLGAELGHLVVDADGPDCPGSCPNRGCLEALCSGQALERDALALARERPDSPLGRLLAEDGHVGGRDVVRAAEQGDADAVALFERLGRNLGVGLSGLANAFEPQFIVIGGGLCRVAELFIDAARAEAARRALPAIWERVTVSLARGGAHAGVIGAGVLAAHEHDALNRDTATTTANEGVS
jgi:glucokinase